MRTPSIGEHGVFLLASLDPLKGMHTPAVSDWYVVSRSPGQVGTESTTNTLV
jgi:hypothetical protein